MKKMRFLPLLVSGMLVFASVWIHEAQAAPTFQAAGTAVGGTGAVSPAWPAHQIDDIALLFVESTGGQAVTLSVPAGFAMVANSPQATGTGTAGTQITVFWARATSTAMPTPTVADPGNHVYAQILTYRNVVNTGNPWDVTGGGVKPTASTSVTVTGVTTTVSDTLVVQAVARDNDSAAAAFSGQTNANLTGIVERSDAGTTAGNGGGFAVWDGVKATAGATGNTTATVTNSINAFLTIALKPGPPAPNCYAVASANWNVASTWASTSGGTPGTCSGAGNVPDATISVFIGETATAYNVTIPAGYAAQAANVTLGDATSVNGSKSLTLATSTASLAVAGNVNIYNPLNNGNTNALNVNAGTVTVGGSLALNGTSANNARVARVNITTGTLTVSGGLTYVAANDARAVIDMSGGAGMLNLAGALTVNNGANQGTLTPGTSSTFNFNGTSDQTIPIGVSNVIYNNLHVNNTSTNNGATLGNNNVTAARVTGNLRIQSGKLDDGGFTIDGNAGKTFEVANGANFIYTTNNWVGGFTRTFGATSTVDYARAGNQTVANESYGHLTLSNSGTKTLPSGTLYIVGNLTMSGTAALDHNNGTVNMNGSAAQAITLNSVNSNLNNLIIANTGAGVSANSDVTLKGNFTNNGVFNAGTSTFTFNDNNPQTIGGTSPTTFYNLVANNTDGGANDIVLNINTTVSNTLTFIVGNISTGSNTLIIGNTTGCGVAGASDTTGYVIGNLRKNFTASLLSCPFEVGDTNFYAPVSNLTFASVTTPGYVTASTAGADCTGVGDSGINAAASVNRCWTLAAGGGLAFTSATATFDYVDPDDLDSGVLPDDFIIRRYVAPSWFAVPVSGVPTTTQTTGTGITAFGDFAIGNPVFIYTRESDFIYTRELYY